MSEKWNNEPDTMKPAEKKSDVEGSAVRSERPLVESDAGGTFTRYVQALASRSEAVDEMGEELLEDLRKALVRELHRRSLWNRPPAYVGVLSGESWMSAPAGASSPLDDLVSECYLFVFGKNLGRLLNQLRVRSEIDGLVVTFIRHFLTDRQKHHDPLGYRLFEIACTAVRRGVDSGDLHVLRGPNKIRNSTVLGTAADSDPDRVSPGETLNALVARWNDTLLPDLVTAERLARRKVTDDLRDHLADLQTEGVTAFRFKNLVDALKQDVRARWRQLHRQEAGETVAEIEDGILRLVEVVRPQARVEDLDSFKKLVRCVSNLIPNVDARRKTKTYLERLWNFLRRWSFETEAVLPSNRKLEEALEIPRDRFTGLYRTLAELSRRCRGKLSGSVVRIDAGRHHPETPTGGQDG